jgi:hypothetical protein
VGDGRWWWQRIGEGRTVARWYRVEHRDGDRVRVLGRLPDVTPHAATLAPFASRLVREGTPGELLLVEEATGTVVARQDLRPGPRRAPRRRADG